MKDVILYTDGACSGNPGKGGIGVVLIYNEHQKRISQGYKLTTNNRMELLAVITGLEALKEPCNVLIHSDSSYIVNAIKNGWLNSWVKNNWRKSNKEKVLNVDLWKRLISLLEYHNTQFVHVKGHSGIHWNEICDELARDAIKGNKLNVDKWYMKMASKQAL